MKEHKMNNRQTETSKKIALYKSAHPEANAGKIATAVGCSQIAVYSYNRRQALKKKAVLEKKAAPPVQLEMFPDNSVDTILDERRSKYGLFYKQAQISQGLKDIVYGQLSNSGKHLAPDQSEALNMILHKIARIVNGDPDHIDSWVDIAGYATLVSDRLQGKVR